MTFVVGAIVGIVGVIAFVAGFAYFVLFSIGRSLFEKALESEAAELGKIQAERAVRSISNLFLGRDLAEKLIAMGGAAAVALTRDILRSRMRTGLWVAAAGVLVFVASFFTGSWLPMVWKGA